MLVTVLTRAIALRMLVLDLIVRFRSMVRDDESLHLCELGRVLVGDLLYPVSLSVPSSVKKASVDIHLKDASSVLSSFNWVAKSCLDLESCACQEVTQCMYTGSTQSDAQVHELSLCLTKTS